MFTPIENEEGFDDEFPEEIDESDSDEEEIQFRSEDRVLMAGKID